MRKFVPHQFAVFAGRSLECRIRREQVAADHAVPVAEARIDMRRHVQRMGVVRRRALVLVRDLEFLVLAARDVVRVHEVVHGTRMIGILFVDPQQDRRGLVGVLSRDHVRRHDGEMRERIERRRLVVVGQRAIELFGGLLPSPDAKPVVFARGLAEESFGGRDVLPLAIRSAAPAFPPSAIRPSRAGAPPVLGAWARAAGTGSWRCPSAPSRTSDQASRLAGMPPAPADRSCDAGEPAHVRRPAALPASS